MERHQQSPRIPESVWKVHEDTIQRVYMTEKQNLETLMEGMAAIHNFDASKKQYRGIFQKWGFNKNNLLNDIPGNDRRRAAQALPKRLVQEPFLIVICCQPSPPEFRWSTEEERQLWRIKVATDTIIKGSFGSTSCKWTLDNFSFFASPIGLSLSYEWQSLESLCTAIADMSGSGVQSHGRGSIELLLQRTEGLKETLSPEYFVVQLAYIWRICLNLTKTRLPLPRYTIPDSQHPISIHPLAPSFLYRLDQQMQTNFREGDPARQVISSLLVILRISPHRFKSALKLAYRMSIKVFENTLGPSHTMVVKMWSHYSRVCGQTVEFKFENEDDVITYINTYIKSNPDLDTPHTLCHASGLIEMLSLESSHQFKNFSKYFAMPPKEEDLSRLEDFAIYLREKAVEKLQVLGGLKDTLAVDVLVYATKLLALKLYKRWRPDYSIRLLDEAIELLQRGGTESIVWASTLSKERLHLLVSQRKYKDVELEKVRLSAIRHAFPMSRRIRSRGSRGITKAENARYLRQQDMEARKEMYHYLVELCREVQQIDSRI